MVFTIPQTIARAHHIAVLATRFFGLLLCTIVRAFPPPPDMPALKSTRNIQKKRERDVVLRNKSIVAISLISVDRSNKAAPLHEQSNRLKKGTNTTSQ